MTSSPTRRTVEAMDTSDPSYAGQHFYTNWFLKVYDQLVLGVFATFRAPNKSGLERAEGARTATTQPVPYIRGRAPIPGHV